MRGAIAAGFRQRNAADGGAHQGAVVTGPFPTASMSRIAAGLRRYDLVEPLLFLREQRQQDRPLLFVVHGGELAAPAFDVLTADPFFHGVRPPTPARQTGAPCMPAAGSSGSAIRARAESLGVLIDLSGAAAVCMAAGKVDCQANEKD